MDYYGFYTGTEFEAYKYLGAHCYGDVTVFRTFAPSAERISLIGEFSDWNEIPMYKVGDGNFWECEVHGAKQYDMYKYRIYKEAEMLQITVTHMDSIQNSDREMLLKYLIQNMNSMIKNGLYQEEISIISL